MKKKKFTDRLRYAFDNTMSRGTGALIGWLALITIISLIIIAAIVWAIGWASQASYIDELWSYVMISVAGWDPTEGYGWDYRITFTVVLIFGTFIVSALIGILATGLDEKIEELQKGRSKVIESNHTVILGWTQQIFAILPELVEANANQPKPRVVILADKDPMEMAEEIDRRIGDTGRTKVILRRGNPVMMTDLKLVSLQTSKSIIILAPDDDDPDASVIKTILAIIRDPQRRPDPYAIVAEIEKKKNLELAKIIGGDEVELILKNDIIARIMAQTSRQSGLSVVYSDLLDFAGDEIYLEEEPALVGKTYREALFSYEDSAVMGLHKSSGVPELSPPMDTVIETGDQIIALSEDDDTVVLSGTQGGDILEGAIKEAPSSSMAPESLLLLGWNAKTPMLIRELDYYIPKGSKMTVLANVDDIDAEFKCLRKATKNLRIDLQYGDTTDRSVLDGLDLTNVDYSIVVSYSDKYDAQRADSLTLMTLLHLRDITEQQGLDFSIVSEMEDNTNRELAAVTKADDFVVSNHVISLMLSQISEAIHLGAVFEDLFDPEGVETYLKPVVDYIEVGQEVNFYTILEAACRRGETALGYRIHADAYDTEKDYGVVLNPVKSEPVMFTDQDQVIVLAED